MEVLRVKVVFMYILAFAFSFVPSSINAHQLPPSPSPTSDGTALDQGIAYVLMLLALALTYIIH
ncbi:hypothetical protein Lal_00009823 [Lupinus albus]|uniref:Putative arabinogalactan peptide, AGP n=1 Tax=Lupinus albus TaxID=3870 RepID=A0A6A5LER8_LUPAL|nr:putative arabinogalactan peptide, AGP [Lupinus albus]KAF1859239.1 hypothetical protein Lal_00009823 [Lupinus albus]